MTLNDIQGYASLTLALIAILAVIFKIWKIPSKVKYLEITVKENNKRIILVEKAIIELNQIEYMTRELYNHFLKKGLESK